MTPRPTEGSDPSASTAGRAWQRRAQVTQWRYNLGCVLAAFLPWVVGASALGACALLLVRHARLDTRFVWIAYTVALAMAAGSAGWQARRRFFTLDDAFARLDNHLGLHNRLTAARAGVGAFPPPPAPRVASNTRATGDGFAFRWERVALPLLGALALVVAAAVVPISNVARAVTAVAPVPPLAWAETARWIDTLQKSDIVQESVLEALRERLEQLRQQPTADWYSQSSLEAGDNLHGQTEQSLRALANELRTAAASLEAMQRFTEQTPTAEIKATMLDLESALKGLEMGNLPLKAELLEGLKGLDPSKIKTLSKEQAEALKKRLKEGAQVCKACLGDGKGDGEGEGGDGLLVAGVGEGHDASGQPGPGGGHQPLTLHEEARNLGTTKIEGVSGDSTENALPGDVLGVGRGKHEIDPAKFTGPTAAGAVAAPGTGGEAVWRDDLTPREREALKSFFK